MQAPTRERHDGQLPLCSPVPRLSLPQDALTVDLVLGPRGALSAALPAYEHRPEQLAMARAVEEAFARRRVLLAEAGTGTGKTLAYLVPAILAGRKTVVSTATRTLQDQLFLKDLPLLRDGVGLTFEAALLKGRQNYLCLLRLERFGQPNHPGLNSREEAGILGEVQAWADHTVTGDRAELDLPESLPLWSRLSTTSDSCLGAKCPLYASCFVTRARTRAAGAQVVVVNHHLFFADLSLRSGEAGEGILPEYEAVIFDEAHALEDAAVAHFGMGVATSQLDVLAHDAAEALPREDGRHGIAQALAVRLAGAAETFQRIAPGVLGLQTSGSLRLAPEQLERLGPAIRPLHDALASLAGFAQDAEEPEVTALARRARTLAEGLDFIARADSRDHVYWAEGRTRGFGLHAAPIDVDAELRNRLYTRVDTLIFTSATLTTERRFDFFAQRMGLTREDGPGLDPGVDQVLVESPFDYRRQAALYVPSHLPEPTAPGFIEEASEEIVSLCRVTGGRAFCLFTSLRNMEAAYWRCRERLGVQVLLQGEAPKAALLEAFQREPSVLFASHSFWEGVDVPGDALSLVIIDRLPFASPGEPLVAARIERLEAQGQSAFGAYQLPQAALTLRQGFGRLIRTSRDLGVVAVLDRRLKERSYGTRLLRSLPRTPRFGTLPEVEAWWDRASTGNGELELAAHQQPQLAALLAHHRGHGGEAVGPVEIDGRRVRRVHPQGDGLAEHVPRGAHGVLEQELAQPAAAQVRTDHDVPHVRRAGHRAVPLDGHVAHRRAVEPGHLDVGPQRRQRAHALLQRLAPASSRDHSRDAGRPRPSCPRRSPRGTSPACPGRRPHSARTRAPQGVRRSGHPPFSWSSASGLQ